MALPALLLGVALVLLWRFARRDVRTFARFAGLEDTQARQRAFLRWGRMAFALFLVQSLVGLALLGWIDALWTFPPAFPGLSHLVPPELLSADFLIGMAGAVLVGGTIGGILAARRKRPIGKVKGLDISPMLPRNRAEALRIALLAGNAAVVEEVFFRLYLPLLLVALGLQAWLAFVVVVLIFALMHRYQGWLGVVLTGLMGAAFTYAYLLGEGLTLPIVVHLVLNMNALLFRPWVAGRLRRGTD